MSGERRGGEGSYARALEKALCRLRGRPVVLSPRDWALASDWHRRGVPLALVLEVLEEAADRGRRRGGGEGPRSLSYVAPAVEENWQLVLRGRARGGATAGRSPEEEARVAWSRARDSSGPVLRRLLTGLLNQLDSGASARDVERELEARLLECTPSEILERSVREVERELDPFRGRMPPRTLDTTRRRALVRRVRAELGLPRLEARAEP